jgi:hypothetical protein
MEKLLNILLFDPVSSHTAVSKSPLLQACLNVISKEKALPLPPVVFKSPVKSGFLTLKWATVDRNRSKPLPILRGLQLNQIGPVLFSSVAPKRPVETGLNHYFYSKCFFFTN